VFYFEVQENADLQIRGLDVRDRVRVRVRVRFTWKMQICGSAYSGSLFFSAQNLIENNNKGSLVQMISGSKG